MHHNQFTIRLNMPDDDMLVDQLCDIIFGPGRFTRTAHRIRENCSPGNHFTLTAWYEDALAGAISFSPVTIGDKKGAFLLGPLAVHLAFIGRSCGLKLITSGIEEVKERGGKLIILVGDLPYYSRAGFVPIPKDTICLPGPVNSSRLLAFECEDGVLNSYTGLVKGL